ncbi:LuxR C-terminal-related transcriptional regulator [Amycolatopsis deserti]|uniref:LuxR C-terminal-related transcriptional regulator n=1 Tax=Amycolatopsis deserti TaxID=185696 RepID=UPI0017487175|nr:LuxR C-terminal-related transcriptional regulator [Amycolatopsis deserti]
MNGDRVRVPREAIVRPRLMRELDQPSALTVLRAPLGFGKTTLVAQWLRGRGKGRAARVRATADTEEFWHRVRDALLDCGAEFGETARSRLHGLVRAVRAAGELVLVIDDFDEVTDDGVERDLLYLLRECDGLRLVVCVRGGRHFRRHHRLDVDTVELTAHDLAFTVDEAEAVLQACGVRGAPAGVIHRECDGWPEPVRAAALVLRERAGRPTPTASAIVSEYLRDRLLSELGDGPLRDLAWAAAVLGPAPAGLLASMADGEDLLERLGALGLVREPDHTTRWPEAARAVLSAEIRSPERVRELRVRAARWYRDHQRPAAALSEAVQAQDRELAVRIISENWLDLLENHADVLASAFAVLPLADLAPSARVMAARDLLLRAPDNHVFAALPSLPASAPPDLDEVLDTGLATLLVLRGRGMLTRAKAHGDRLLALAGAGSPRSSRLFREVGTTRLLTGDLLAARSALSVAVDLAPPGGAAEAADQLALVSLATGGDLPDGAGTTTLTRAIVALNRLDLTTAAECVTHLHRQSRSDVLWPFTAFVHSGYLLDAGDALGGLKHLDQVRADHRHDHGPGTLAGALLAAAEAGLLIALGHGNQAGAVLDGFDPRHPLLRVIRARLLLLGGNPREALHLGEDPAWLRTAPRSLELEMLLIRAIAQFRSDDRAGAAETLRRAAASARRTGLLRPFRTVPRAELDELADQAGPEAVALLREPALRALPDLYPARLDLVVLTDRERLILGYLAAGLPSQRIAHQLFISYNTVKTHVRGLYRKLQAGSRDEALARAHALGLLPVEPALTTVPA